LLSISFDRRKRLGGAVLLLLSLRGGEKLGQGEVSPAAAGKSYRAV